jgi:hypothetical protein
MVDDGPNRSLDEAISQLIAEHGGGHDTDYVKHLIVTALGLGQDNTSTLDLKIASSALKEMREAFSMFDPYADRKKLVEINQLGYPLGCLLKRARIRSLLVTASLSRCVISSLEN